MEKIYISGKITGEVELSKTKFGEMEKKLSPFYEVFNPHEISSTHGITINEKALKSSNYDKTIWEEYMKICVKNLVDCNLVMALDNWKTSERSRTEIALAKKLGIMVIGENGKELPYEFTTTFKKKEGSYTSILKSIFDKIK